MTETKVTVITTPSSPNKHSLTDMIIGDSIIRPTAVARDSGVMFDKVLTRNASQTIFQRSLKTSEEEAWQTPDDMDNNYSTIPIQERHTHKYS